MPDITPGMISTSKTFEGRGIAILRNNNQYEILFEGTPQEDKRGFNSSFELTPYEGDNTYTFRNTYLPPNQQNPLKITLALDEEGKQMLKKFLDGKKLNPTKIIIFF